MKRSLIFIIILNLSVSALMGEMIPKAAIIDLERIMTVFYKESEPVRELEMLRNQVQDEINSLAAEINNLKETRVEALREENDDEAERLGSLILDREKYFRELYSSRQRQLNEMKENLTSNSDFYKEILKYVEFIAQSKGYTYVMKSSDPDLFWASPEIDITDLVIEYITSNN